MWANSVWGLFGLFVTFAVLRIGMIWNHGYGWLSSWFTGFAIFFLILSIIVLIWPFAFHRKLKLEFNKDLSGCVVDVPEHGTHGKIVAKAFRLMVNSKHKTVSGCHGQLLSISGPLQKVFDHQPLSLTFAFADKPDTLSKTIAWPVPQYLDVINIFDSNRIEVAVYERHFPNGFDAHNFFNNNGDYIFTIAVQGQEVDAALCNLCLKWNGDWQTATMEMIS